MTRVQFLIGAVILIVTITSKQVLFTIQWIPWLKQSEPEADHSPSTNVEVENVRS
jgi:hypothetical protein